MKRNNILFVVPSLRIGGVEKSFVNFINSLKCENSCVDLKILDNDGYEAYKDCIPKYVNILPEDNTSVLFKTFKNSIIELLKSKRILLAAKRTLCPLIKLFYNICVDQAFWKVLKSDISALNKEYDLAVAYADGKATYYVSDKVNAKYKFAWVHTDHEKANFNIKMDKTYYSKFNYTFCVSEFLATQIKRNLNVNSVKVLYNIFMKEDVDYKAATGMPEVYDKSLVNIVTVGRLSYEKGYDRVICVANELNKMNFNFKWFIIGEGNYRNKTEKMIKKFKLQNKVILLGNKSNPYPYIKMADVYVQLSRYEGFSTTILEALYLNKFIITTEVSGVNEQVIENENGIVLNDWTDATGAIVNYDGKLKKNDNERIFGSYTIQDFIDVVEEYKIDL